MKPSEFDKELIPPDYTGHPEEDDDDDDVLFDLDDDDDYDERLLLFLLVLRLTGDRCAGTAHRRHAAGTHRRLAHGGHARRLLRKLVRACHVVIRFLVRRTISCSLR